LLTVTLSRLSFIPLTPSPWISPSESSVFTAEVDEARGGRPPTYPTKGRRKVTGRLNELASLLNEDEDVDVMQSIPISVPVRSNTGPVVHTLAVACLRSSCTSANSDIRISEGADHLLKFQMRHCINVKLSTDVKPWNLRTDCGRDVVRHP